MSLSGHEDHNGVFCIEVWPEQPWSHAVNLEVTVIEKSRSGFGAS